MSSILRRLPPSQKRRIKALRSAWKLRWVSMLRSYGPADLSRCLRSLGVGDGDSVLVHVEVSTYSGFTGSVGDITDVLLRTVGPDGNLAMVSLPYRTSSRQYLESGAVFDVRRTPSEMGLISEFFRRRKGVLRSLHPTHPVLACGSKAEWIVADHESCLFPCGPGTPFDKLLDLGGKVVFFDVPFDVFTFVHFLEHRVRDHLSFSLYEDEPYEVPITDYEGRRRVVRTYVFSREAIRRRHFATLEKELNRRHRIRRGRVGNTTVLAVDLEDAVACVDEMTNEGVYFYDDTR